MLTSQGLPTSDELLPELKRLREAGLTRLDELDLPELLRAARLATADETGEAHVVIETTLRRAIARLGGGRYGETASVLYGLSDGTRAFTAGVRRTMAAAAFGRSSVTFRKKYESGLLSQIAAQILALGAEQRVQQARLQRQPQHPAESTMAVEWLRRFETYYRIWSAASGLGADLTAYRSTMLEHDRLWDRRYGTRGPKDEGWSQEEQAQGHAHFGLYHYAKFKWEVKQFDIASGGLWILPDAEAEQTLADAAYKITWYSPYNEMDDSFFRNLIAESRDQEMYGFIKGLFATEPGRLNEQEWQDWAAECECTWEPAASRDDEPFPTWRHHKGISERCDVHQVIVACGTYLDLVDQGWRQVADWYRLPDKARRGLSGESLYVDWLSKRKPPDA